MKLIFEFETMLMKWDKNSGLYIEKGNYVVA